MDIPTDTQGYLTSQGTARLFNVSLRTVQLWLENGSLHAWKTATGQSHISCESVNTLLSKHNSELHSGKRQLKVLVVEDEKVQLMMYRLKFSRWDLPVQLETASNGFEALAKMHVHNPDVLITDLNMPAMDGFQMLRNLESSSDFGNMKLIAITSLTREDIARQGGLPDSITLYYKPIPLHLLCQLFRDMLTEEISASL